jgi:hypothetical protein
MLPTDIFPSKLCHVSPLSPDRFSNGKIISHENISITGEKINAIWATDKEDDQNIYLGKGFGGVVAIKKFLFYMSNKHNGTFFNSEGLQSHQGNIFHTYVILILRLACFHSCE